MGDFALFKMSKRTNLDLKDAACLHIVHNLEHPTSHPTTEPTQTTMMITLKMNFSPLPAGKYGKLTKRSTQQHHQANEGKSCLDAGRDQALGALHSSWSNKKLVAEKWQETHILSHEVKAKWNEDYVDTETAGARKRVEDAEAAIR